MISCCGLDCSECNLHNLLHDDEVAERTINWFKEKGWLKENEGLEVAIQKKMYCTGCQNDRTTHWSSNCEILKCCVDEKKLNNCSQCSLFPCEKLTIHANKDERYREALAKLTTMV